MRTESVVRAAFAHDQRTRIRSLYQAGSLRLKLPRAHGVCEAVLVNTGGGIAGGDRLSVGLELGEGGHVVATSQAAEKIYRAESDAAAIEVNLRLGPGSRLDWLPQETILYDRARLTRRLAADMAADAALTMLEVVVLGRAAHGERVENGLLRDRWRVRRAGRLVLAEDVRLDGDVARLLAVAALGGGARAMATLIHVSARAEARLEPVRAALEGAACECGASSWNGVLAARFAGADPHAVRDAAARAAVAVTGAALPRSWSC